MGSKRRPDPDALDVLAIGAHPDDVELFMGGTLRQLALKGRRVGVLDLTRGEHGTRGSMSIRQREAGEAARRMGLAWRGSAGLPDGRLVPSPAFRDRVADRIRRFRPDTVLGIATDRRHPDHSAAETLAHDAAFVAGLRRAARGGPAPHRPRKFLLATGFRTASPNLLVDITAVFPDKREIIRCYRSQFEPSGWRILDWIEALARRFGMRARIPFAEGFIQREPFVSDDLSRLPGISF